MAHVSVTRIPATLRPQGGGLPGPGATQRAGAAPAEIAVVVTVHKPYLRYLRECLDSIERQWERANGPQGLVERVVALDGCTPPRWLRRRAGWRLVAGQWAQSSLARNAGLWATRAPWIVWFDADNIMPPTYLAAMTTALEQAAPEVGIVYPDLQWCDERMAPTRLRRMPEHDYWLLRRSNYVDTSAAWRREAVEEAGGWPVVPVLDDHALALRVTAAGWEAQHLHGPAVLWRRHEGQRSETRWDNPRKGLAALWETRTLAVVTLLAGRRPVLDQWLNWLNAADLPPQTTVYAVDNSGDPQFGADVCAALEGVPARARYMVDSARLEGAVTGLTRHQHISALYNRVLADACEDLVLTLEDDVLPPPDAVRILHEHYDLDSAVGAAAATYASPTDPRVACAARDVHLWRHSPPLGEVGEPEEVGFVGAGCTLYANCALRRVLPRTATIIKGSILGWDALVSAAIRAEGFRVLLDGRVRCEHHVHGERP